MCTLKCGALWSVCAHWGQSHDSCGCQAEKKGKKRRKRNSSSVPEAATSDFQPPAQSGVGGVPSVRRQMDGDFLLCAFTGVVTVQCESDPVSQFDKWGTTMKANQRKRRRLRSGSSAQSQEHLSALLEPPANKSPLQTQPCRLPPSLANSGAHFTQTSGPWRSARIVALPERQAITGHASPI